MTALSLEGLLAVCDEMIAHGDPIVDLCKFLEVREAYDAALRPEVVRALVRVAVAAIELRESALAIGTWGDHSDQSWEAMCDRDDKAQREYAAALGGIEGVVK